jgi:hypothetical protein
MSKCPQVEIQKLEERLEVAAYVATDRQVYIAELEAENAQLQAIVYAANAVMRSYKHKNAGWSVSGVYAELEQAIKEVGDE